MINISSLKSEWVYWFLGLLFSSLLLVVLFYSLDFLVENFNTALNSDLIKTEPTVQFNLEKLKDVGI